MPLNTTRSGGVISGVVAITLSLGCDRPSAKDAPEPRAPAAASVPPADAPAPSTSIDAEEPSVESLCAPLAKVQLPSQDRPPQTELLALAGCDAEALYYGIGRAPDQEKARHCAYLGRDARGESQEILMMIYANGQGVPRNLDAARRLACELGGADAEVRFRLQHLKKLETSQEPFDFCDDVTIGHMSGACAALHERTQAEARRARKTQVTAGLPAAPLARLERAARAFFDARAQHEVDRTGSMRAALAIAERAALEDRYVQQLEQLRDPSFPKPAPDPVKVERELSDVYARLMRCQDLVETAKILPGSVQPKGIRTTQRLWQAYRTGFIDLALSVRPGTSRKSWLAFWAEERVRALFDLLPPSC